MAEQNISILLALTRIKGLLKKMETQLQIILDELCQEKVQTIITEEDYE